METLKSRRLCEIEKYTHAYQHDMYRMGERRKTPAHVLLAAAPSRDSYLDVGCGRAEMLDYAARIGFKEVIGTEVVLGLLRYNVRFALAHELPFDDNEFAIVSCFDVLEHLLPEDTEAVLQELDRVAAKQLILTANNQHSKSLGVELHVNRRPYDEWDQLIREHTSGQVRWLPRDAGNISETWTVTK